MASDTVIGIGLMWDCLTYKVYIIFYEWATVESFS